MKYRGGVGASYGARTSMTVSFTFIRCGRMDLMYTDTAMPGRRSARGSARPDRLGVSSMNTPYGSMERTTPRTVSPTENSAAFCAQVPSSSRWVSEMRRFSGSTGADSG